MDTYELPTVNHMEGMERDMNDDLISRQEAIDKWNALDNPDEYIVLKGKAALIVSILLEIYEEKRE